MKNKKITFIGVISLIMGLTLLGVNLNENGYSLNSTIISTLSFIFGASFLLSTFVKSTEFEFIISEQMYKTLYRIFGVICLIVAIII